MLTNREDPQEKAASLSYSAREMWPTSTTRLSPLSYFPFPVFPVLARTCFTFLLPFFRPARFILRRFTVLSNLLPLFIFPLSLDHSLADTVLFLLPPSRTFYLPCFAVTNLFFIRFFPEILQLQRHRVFDFVNCIVIRPSRNLLLVWIERRQLEPPFHFIIPLPFCAWPSSIFLKLGFLISAQIVRINFPLRLLPLMNHRFAFNRFTPAANTCTRGTFNYSSFLLEVFVVAAGRQGTSPLSHRSQTSLLSETQFRLLE